MSQPGPVMIICPVCTTANRVPRDKLAASAVDAVELCSQPIPSN